MAGLMSLLKPALKVGSVLAAPATGGASLAALPALSTIGSAASGMAGGMADERGRENVYNTNANAADTSRHATKQNATTQLAGLDEKAIMDRAQLGITAPTARANQVLKGSLMELLQPVQMSHPRATMAKVSGGLSPAAFSNLVRNAGKTLQTQGTEALETKSDVPAAADYSSRVLDAPKLRDYEDAGLGETIAGTGGMISSILGALARTGAGK